jgi:glycosyltransferase involved in cell wall biosynthesis
MANSNTNAGKGSGRCLLVECCPWHEETLANWVYLLGSLGYSVDVYSGRSLAETNALGFTSLNNFTLNQIDAYTNIDSRKYDFVILNTLLHEGYLFPPPNLPMPTVQFLRRLQLPSISFVHEPKFWSETRLVDSFRVTRPGESHDLFLFSDHTCMEDSLRWYQGCWDQQENALLIPNGKTHHRFESGDGGNTFACRQDPGCVMTRTEAYGLTQHLRTSRNAVLTLTRPGMHTLQTHFDVAGWIMPVYFGEFEEPATYTNLVVPGEVNYERKNFTSLIKAADEIRNLRDDAVYIVGGARGFADAAQSGRQVQRLEAELAGRGLTDKVLMTGYLPYGAYYNYIRRSRFIVPLIDETIDGGSYLTKMSAAVAQSLAFGVPMIINRKIATQFGLEFMICYEDDDLAAGIRQYHQLGEEPFREMKRLTIRKREEIAASNQRAFGEVVAQILRTDAGCRPVAPAQ